MVIIKLNNTYDSFIFGYYFFSDSMSDKPKWIFDSKIEEELLKPVYSKFSQLPRSEINKIIVKKLIKLKKDEYFKDWKKEDWPKPIDIIKSNPLKQVFKRPKKKELITHITPYLVIL